MEGIAFRLLALLCTVGVFGALASEVTDRLLNDDTSFHSVTMSHYLAHVLVAYTETRRPGGPRRHQTVVPTRHVTTPLYGLLTCDVVETVGEIHFVAVRPAAHTHPPLHPHPAVIGVQWRASALPHTHRESVAGIHPTQQHLLQQHVRTLHPHTSLLDEPLPRAVGDSVAFVVAACPRAPLRHHAPVHAQYLTLLVRADRPEV